VSRSAHNRKRFWLRALQIALSVGLLSWLLLRFEWSGVLRAVLGASPLLMAFAIGVYYVGVLVSCLKWRLTLTVEGITLPLSLLLRWYLIGAFVSNFLPSDIGGDLGRGYFAVRQTGRAGAVTRSILVERLSGLAAMLVLAWIGALVFFPGLRWLILGGTLGAFAVAGVLLLGAGRNLRLRRWMAGRFALLPPRLHNGISSSWEVGQIYLSRPAVIAKIAVISFGFQVLAGCGLWLNLSAVGVDVPLAPVILVMALASLASLLPIAVNGWGVREGVLVSLLALIGAPPELVLAAALLARVLVLVVTLPGGLLLLTTGSADRPSRI
jgi:glycosyltransferase 2 family protein